MDSESFFSVNGIKGNPILERFAKYSILSPPGTSITDGKVLKKKDKLTVLLKNVGHYGPILDLLIRGTVTHLVVHCFSKDVRSITSPDNGDLWCLLAKYFKEETKIWDGVKAWFKNGKMVEDYETSFRHFRCELLNSQLSTIVLRPQNKVNKFDIIIYYIYFSLLYAF